MASNQFYLIKDSQPTKVISSSIVGFSRVFIFDAIVDLTNRRKWATLCQFIPLVFYLVFYFRSSLSSQAKRSEADHMHGKSRISPDKEILTSPFPINQPISSIESRSPMLFAFQS
jgi:hypothetical protein